MRSNTLIPFLEDDQRINYKSPSSVIKSKPAGKPSLKSKPAAKPPVKTKPAGKPPVKSIPATVVIEKVEGS